MPTGIIYYLQCIENTCNWQSNHPLYVALSNNTLIDFNLDSGSILNILPHCVFARSTGAGADFLGVKQSLLFLKNCVAQAFCDELEWCA